MLAAGYLSPIYCILAPGHGALADTVHVLSCTDRQNSMCIRESELHDTIIINNIIIYTNALKQPFDIAEMIEDLGSFCLVKQIMIVVGLLLASKMGNDIAQPYIFFVAFILRARI